MVWLLVDVVVKDLIVAFAHLFNLERIAVKDLVVCDQYLRYSHRPSVSKGRWMPGICCRSAWNWIHLMASARYAGVRLLMGDRWPSMSMHVSLRSGAVILRAKVYSA